MVERLIDDGYKVIGIDNFCTGHKENKKHLTHRYAESELQFIEADVVEDWPEILKKLGSKEIKECLKNLKLVFHFASPASPPHYQRLSVETIWVNTKGLENCIKLADAHNAKVIFASTSEVYGDPSVHPQPENYWGNVNSFGPRSCYDESKRCGEAIIYSYNARNKTQHGMVRIFNTYGPRMNPEDGRVVINFLIQGLKGKSLTVYGEGKQTRSFCYVDDLIEAIIRYSKTQLTQPVNIGNPKEFTILELAQIVQKMFAPTASKKEAVELTFEPMPIDDPRQRRPDISLAYEVLSGWTPKIPLEQGLKQMVEWLKNY